jgi:hypothetical protein
MLSLMAKRRKRIPAVVPKIVFSTVFVGVVPACVVSACNSGTVSTNDEAGFRGVAAVAYQCFDADPRCTPPGVAAACFDGGRVVPCNPIGVDSATDGPDDGPSDASDDGDGADAKG